MPHLSPETVEELIAELGRPKYGHLIANDTPFTMPTPATRVLARHPESGESVRRAMRTNPSPQVRRFAAFTLGEIRYGAAIPDLQAAIRSAMEAPEIEENHGTELDPRGILNAAIKSYAKIDHRGAIEYVIAFLRNERVATRQRAWEAMSLLQIHIAHPPSCTDEQVRSGECGRLWQEWWATARLKYERRSAAAAKQR